jgi:hypothetical protein
MHCPNVCRVSLNCGRRLPKRKNEIDVNSQIPVDARVRLRPLELSDYVESSWSAKPGELSRPRREALWWDSHRAPKWRSIDKAAAHGYCSARKQLHLAADKHKKKPGRTTSFPYSGNSSCAFDAVYRRHAALKRLRARKRARRVSRTKLNYVWWNSRGG